MDQKNTALLETKPVSLPLNGKTKGNGAVNGKHAAPAVSFTLNGTTVTGRSGETILEAAQRHGVEIPRLECLVVAPVGSKHRGVVRFL